MSDSVSVDILILSGCRTLDEISECINVIPSAGSANINEIKYGQVLDKTRVIYSADKADISSFEELLNKLDDILNNSSTQNIESKLHDGEDAYFRIAIYSSRNIPEITIPNDLLLRISKYGLPLSITVYPVSE
jgi:hypothetical protein